MSDSGRQSGDDDVKVSLSVNEIRVLKALTAKHAEEVANDALYACAPVLQKLHLHEMNAIRDKLNAATDAFFGVRQ